MIRNPVITELRHFGHGQAMARKSSTSARARAFIEGMKDNKTNAHQVADRADVKYTTLASFLQGDTQSLKGTTEEKLVAGLGFPAEVLFGGGAAPRTAKMPVISWVQAGALRDPASQVEDPTQTIEISGLEAGDYFATRVQGDSMNRISPHGSMLIVNRAETEPVRGRRYTFARRGETTFKRYERDPIRLEPESTMQFETIFPKNEEDWIVIGRVRLTLMDDI